MDHLRPHDRSIHMGRIRGANTKPELMVRKVAQKLGLRFRIHRRDLPGTPDLVLPKHCLAIFVHGCFWHRHEGCRRASTPATNSAFWTRKFEQNVARDAAAAAELRQAGWRVLVIWECEVKISGLVAQRLTQAVSEAVES